MILHRLICVLVLSALAGLATATELTAHTSGGFTIPASDGFDLWFDAQGDGPGIIFLAREPNENRNLADALSDQYRVVLFEPRFVTRSQQITVQQVAEPLTRSALENHLADRNIDWELPTERFPMELMIDDLHRVADAVGLDQFVLAGYSGTARLASLFAPESDRAIGLIVGGFDILGSLEFWLGYTSGSSAAVLQRPEVTPDEISMALFSRTLHQYEIGRDNTKAFGGLPGPKVVWVGGQDGGPEDDLANRIFWRADIASGVVRRMAEYRRLGFSVITIPGVGHLDAFMSAETAAAGKIRAALIQAGYK
ncbi:MAG: hypothetical protein QNJ40_10725 [Xanthomonadales bacterium]|nr:hypothetical protein [Xanthomonadales bacterium]